MFDTNDEVVHLTENAETIELLFQFIYPRCHPDLADTAIVVLEPFAEAAEKYEVFPAMNIVVRMEYVVVASGYRVLIRTTETLLYILMKAVRHDISRNG